MPKKQLVEVGGPEYLASLTLGRPAEPLSPHVDGAELWRVGTEHYVLLVCTEHPHQGAEVVAQRIPRSWVCFYVGVNPDLDYEAHHFGPEWKDAVDAH